MLRISLVFGAFLNIYNYMKLTKHIILYLSLISLPFIASGQTDIKDNNFHIYICFGQSNMKGSAPIEPCDTIAPDRFIMLSSTDMPQYNRNLGEWYSATPPLSQPKAKLSPIDYFGRTLVKELNDSIKIGVVVVAIGGCDIRIFDKECYLDYHTKPHNKKWFSDEVRNYGGDPYHRLIHLAKIAQRSGVIKGILLHQGETNTGDKKWGDYVAKIYSDMLEDLSLSQQDTPLLVGEVVGNSANGKCARMNEIIRTIPSTIPTAHVISSEGCSAMPDNLHFDSNGVRTLGERYAKKILELAGK